MPAYVFKGKTRAGAATSGERNADSKDAVIAMLRREQILVTSVKESLITTSKNPLPCRSGTTRCVHPRMGNNFCHGPKEKGKEFALPKFGTGITHKDVAIFVRQFSVMIDAGLPLVQCLEILGSQQDNPNFAKVLIQSAPGRRRRLVARGLHEETPEGVRRPVHEHDRRR